MLDAADIKRLVHMDTIVAWYGLEPNRARFIPCPFHGDTDPSLKIYRDGGGWHCFGCGAGSSVIDFVMLMEECSFQDACKKITERAGLDGYRSVQRDPVARDYTKQFHKNAEERKKQEVDIWLSKVRRYRQTLETGTEWSEQLEEACQNIAYAEYRLEKVQGLYDE